MALITFFDASELDKAQLSETLKDTDHHWDFIEGSVSTSNLNPEAEVISVFVSSNVTKEIIESLPKLRLIACRSTGYNNIDLSEAAARNITVVNVPTYGESTVAEYTFALLLSLSRRLHVLMAGSKTQTELLGHDLAGKTLGVIGTGHIGQKVISIAKGFQMNVVAYDPFPNESTAERLAFSYAELEEVLRSSDAVTLHAPYVPQTHHMLGEDQFSLMKPTAFLINTARGELLDTGALVNALSNQRLAGVALDVIEGEALLNVHEEVALLRTDSISEPLTRHSIEISALEKMPNVIFSPHNAFNSVEAIQRINSTTAQNIIGYWYGDNPNAIKTGTQQTGKLLLVRHAESEWNATGRWSGLRDVHLSEKGFYESALLGIELKKLGIRIDHAFCSEQIRTRETLEGILSASQQIEVPVLRCAELNERDYGIYTGKNKWEMKEVLGEEKWDLVRRGWDEPVPKGETLKDVYERAVPMYLETVVPLLQAGKNVLITAHGNSIRSLMKYIDSITNEGVADLEMLFGTIVVYAVDSGGRSVSRTSSTINSPPPNA